MDYYAYPIGDPSYERYKELIEEAKTINDIKKILHRMNLDIHHNKRR